MKGDGDKKEKKNGKRRSNGGGGEREVVTDARFASVHTDPRFQKTRPKERKVQIDSRFDKMFTDKKFGSSAAPVDKRGRKKERKENPLERYYELEEEEGRVRVGSGLEDDEVEGERSSKESEDDDMEEFSDVEIDTDDDEMLIGGSESESEQEEVVPEIDQETSRLAAVNLDWHHLKAVDLYVLLNSFLPDGGRIQSVTVYPSEFGMERMKEEAVHGPVGLFDDDGKKSAKKIQNDEDGSDSESESDDQNGNEDDGEHEDGQDSESDYQNAIEDDGENESEYEESDDNLDENEEEEEEEEDRDFVDERVRNYEKTRLRQALMPCYRNQFLDSLRAHKLSRVLDHLCSC